MSIAANAPEHFPKLLRSGMFLSTVDRSTREAKPHSKIENEKKSAAQLNRGSGRLVRFLPSPTLRQGRGHYIRPGINQ